MSYSIYVTQTFKKEFKKLAKKYPSLKSDLENLSNELLSKPTAGKSNISGRSSNVINLDNAG